MDTFINTGKMDFIIDTALKTKQGIDKTNLMLFFIPVLEAESGKQASKAIDKLKSFLVEKLKRGLTGEECISMLQGCLDYAKSDAGTPERFAAMNYLFELKFLKD